MSGVGEWTHPSVVQLLGEAGVEDPVREIERRAADVALSAMEAGWQGPPFDPFELADHLGVEVVGRDELEDARLVSVDDKPRIEFNPTRRPARVRFSLAHELGHLLFTDHGERVRYRDRSHDEPTPADDWQLEMLCNVAAAELLMPAGAFPPGPVEDLSLVHLLDLRARFGVSTEALLRRVVKMSDRPVALFACARRADGQGFRVDYSLASRAWTGAPPRDASVPERTVLERCTAIGFSVDEQESWSGQELRVQAVGVPPYPGDRFPRVVGLLAPVGESPSDGRLRYLRGDAAQPARRGPLMIAHVVNDRARRWSQRGFAGALMRAHPRAAELYEVWSTGHQLTLGEAHVAEVEDGLWVASLVAQRGYGDSVAPRLQVRALRQALARAAESALEAGATVHMPLMGTGQAGGSWPVVRDLVVSELVDRDVPVTVHVLPGQPMPGEEVQQMSLI